MLFRQHRDQAVDRRAYRFASLAQGAIEIGGPEVEVDAPGFEKVEIPESLGQALPAGLLAQTLEGFRHHDTARADRVIAHQEIGDRPLFRGIVTVEEIDSRRGVDEDPQSPLLLPRSSSKFPSQRNFTWNWRMSRTRRLRAYSRSASLMTSVLVLPGDTPSWRPSARLRRG